MDDFHIFLPLSKVEKQADGSRIITGYASTPSKDLDGEVVTLNAVRKALPSYMEWRNIRQMHQDIAVGVAKEASVDKNGLFLRAKIVEPTCIKLIDEDVLKGFSIGGKKVKKIGNEITEIDLIEISVVDRPANPDCRFEVQKMAKGAVTIGDGKGDDVSSDTNPDEIGWLRKTVERLLSRELSADSFRKTAETAPSPVADDDTYYEELSKRKFTPKAREEAADKGHAMPGGGYPIENSHDVRNAVQAFGRAKNPDATKKHIIQQAKRLGATHLLPADWEGSTKSEKSAMIDIFKAVKQTDFGWEHFDALVKAAPTELEVPPEAGERLAKGLGTVGDLSYAFSTIRGCQRRLIAEGVIEKDGEDAELARRLGQVAAELASVISEKAQHEASEAVYMTDSEDLTSYMLNNEGFSIMTLSANKDDLAKRASKAVRAHMDKVKDHLDKAMSAHGEALKCLGKAGQMLASDMGKAAAGGTLDKGSTAKIMDNLKKAFEGFSASADHMELGKAAMAKASSADVTAPGPGANTGGMSSIDQATMTEGEVPWYDATEDYFAAARARTSGADGAEVYTKSEVEAMLKAATAESRSTVLEQQNKTLTEMLAKTPAGARKSVVFPAPDKGVLTGHEGDGSGDRNAVLLDGIDLSNVGDPDSRRKAAGTMIANMIGNPKMFAKSLFDPSFKGLAGTKRAS